MSLLGTHTFVFAVLGSLALLTLGACTQSAKGGSGPMSFLEAKVTVLNYDMIEVNASVLNPVEGANRAYSDCAAARFALTRLNPYVRRVTSKLLGHGDIVTEKTTYLLSPVAPAGDYVLNASQIVDKCNKGGVPTV